RVVVLLPDSIRNYLTKFASDHWMRQNGFFQNELETGTIGEALLAMSKRDVISVMIDDSVQNAMAQFKQHGISQMPVLDAGKLAGILTEYDLLQALVSGRVSQTTKVAEVMVRRVSTVGLNASASELPRIFERGEVAIVTDQSREVLGIITKMDLIELLASGVTRPPTSKR
ncbi:MAG TPA: CBS domain-containing protein, partial [Sorangium sp.]|nr:CBS domain-containing protein [Sorangium sp.]